MRAAQRRQGSNVRYHAHAGTGRCAGSSFQARGRQKRKRDFPLGSTHSVGLAGSTNSMSTPEVAFG